MQKYLRGAFGLYVQLTSTNEVHVVGTVITIHMICGGNSPHNSRDLMDLYSPLSASKKSSSAWEAFYDRCLHAASH
jgi:hypothetical protein